jgi:hypothetical protein
MKRVLVVGAVVAIAAGVSMHLSLAQSACVSSVGLNFVCGLQAPEDLVRVPNTKWLIASALRSGSGLHLIDTQTKAAREFFSARVSSFQPDTTKFDSCPGPFDPARAGFVGLYLRPAGTDRYTLYAVHHGSRESIEAFEIDAHGAAPSAAWIGCVLLPDKMPANSVAVFADGAIVATVVTLPGTTFEEMMSGHTTGVVMMWTPGSKQFRPLPGTELSGNNGIETSTDDREFYVAATGSMRVAAFSRADPSKPLRVTEAQAFRPDNLRRAGDRLIVAGSLVEEPSCGGRVSKPAELQCPRGWIAASLDPKTMNMTEIARGAATPSFTGASTAIPVDDNVWVGSFAADRIAYLPLKRR